MSTLENEVFLVEKIINQVQTISNLTTETQLTTSGEILGVMVVRV